MAEVRGRALLLIALLAAAWCAALAEEPTDALTEDGILAHSRDLQFKLKPKTKLGKLLLKKALKVKKLILEAGAIFADWLADGLAGEDTGIKSEDDIEDLDLGSVCNTALEAGVSCEYVMESEYPHLKETLRSSQKVVTIAEGNVVENIENGEYEYVVGTSGDEEYPAASETEHYEYIEIPSDHVQETKDEGEKEYIEVDGKYYEVDYVDYVPVEDGEHEGETQEVVYVTEAEAGIEDDPEIVEFKLAVIDMLRSTSQFKRKGVRFIKKMLGKI